MSDILRRLMTETWPAKAAKSALEALMLPGQVAGGQLATQPSTPGMWSDEDESRSQLTQQGIGNRSTDLAGLLMGGGYPMAQTGALGMAGGKLPGNIFDAVAKRHPDVTLDGAVSQGYGTLSRIQVPPEKRGSGLARAAMQDLVAEADAAGIPLALSPSSDWGASKARLAEFYKSLGFVQNAGRSKDFATRETMIRPPRAK
jgi:GNAT superfamily N-acetyltransferase